MVISTMQVLHLQSAKKSAGLLHLFELLNHSYLVTHLVIAVKKIISIRGCTYKWGRVIFRMICYELLPLPSRYKGFINITKALNLFHEF